jgi:RNA-directed DNA polymerase
MPASVRQELAGVVVNVKTNGRREDFDSLKAILTNCRRHGPASQNQENHADFRNHLLGRIAHWTRLRRERGLKLRALFDCIEWPSQDTGRAEPFR